MDSFLTTLYFRYFKATERVQAAKVANGLPKAAGEFDVHALELQIALERQKEAEDLVTEYTLILKAEKNNR